MEKSFLEKVQEKFGNEIFDEYKFLSEYKKYNEKINIEHKICGCVFSMRPNDFLNGHRCPNCARQKRAKKSTITIESYKEKVESIFPGEYEILSDSITKLSDKIKIKHLKCGNIYEATARNLLRGMGCRKCSYEKTGAAQRGKEKPHTNIKTTEEFKKDVLKAIGPEYEVIGTYKTSSTPIKIKHKCGKEYFVLPHNIITHKTGCPDCVDRTRSKDEKDLSEFISSIYLGKIINNYRLTNNNKTFELDIFIPELKIGIEYNGLYYHSDDKIGKNYHLDKMNFFYKEGIRLIQIFEDEWKLKCEIVKTKLKNILGVSNSEKIYARKTIIKDICVNDKNEFLNKYHIQGKDTCKYSTGLFYNNELVAVMTFSKPRIISKTNKSEYEYELSRFATKYNVIGGFSKLLKYMLEKYNIKKIRTYADLRWSSQDSNVYIKNGFKLISKSKPCYWYVAKNSIIREHRFKYKKNSLKNKIKDFDENKTEIENMKNNGFLVVYDCGNLVYEFEVDNAK